MEKELEILKNMSDLVVNKVALASDLADHMVREEFLKDFNEEDLDSWLFEVDEETEETKYVPEAQVLFDSYYDQFMTIIERNEMQYKSIRDVS